MPDDDLLLVVARVHLLLVAAPADPRGGCAVLDPTFAGTDAPETRVAKGRTPAMADFRKLTKANSSEVVLVNLDRVRLIRYEDGARATIVFERNDEMAVDQTIEQIEAAERVLVP